VSLWVWEPRAKVVGMGKEMEALPCLLVMAFPANTPSTRKVTALPLSLALVLVWVTVA